MGFVIIDLFTYLFIHLYIFTATSIYSCHI